MIPPAPNLARRPFANTRPATRLALALWAAGALLLAGNAAVYWSYFAGSGDRRAELARLEQQVVREQQREAQAETALAGIDLAGQNEQVDFLNRKIAERAFSWSLLFDRVAEVLPDAVRLTSLRPYGVVADDARRRTSRRVVAEEGRVALEIRGQAKSGEALLRFVDNLFAHPAFAEPDLSQEAMDQGELIDFNLRVHYLPEVAESVAAIEEGAPPARAAAEPEDDGPPPRYPMLDEEEEQN
ncbi:MAG TPA: PilN domain-containing protein [Thermoanaerobaculia bacterium]|nr:PilN domain-containing protein [Thermoanaerobaculia bacterium]